MAKELQAAENRPCHKVPWILCALAIVVFSSFSFGTSNGPVAEWSFDTAANRATPDSISNSESVIGGLYQSVPGVSGKGLRFDGYTTSVHVTAENAPKLGGSFSVEAWVALNTYPWNWVPVVDQEQNQQAGYFFGIDAFGHLGFQAEVNGQWESLNSEAQLPLKKWAHIVGTFDPNSGMTIYIDGKPAGHLEVHGRWTGSPGESLLIGRIRHSVLPAEWLHPQYPVWYSLDGILDEVEIYNRVLKPGEIGTAYRRANAPTGEVLPWATLPSGPPGPGRFGAYYCTLKYESTWDRQRRIGPDSDVVVRFDNSPARLVFWQGASYIPAWVTENGKWYTDEFLEAGSHENCPAGKDCEPMSDKQDRYSHVSILESDRARVVIHWRYALAEVEDYMGADPDPLTGWFDWADEYWTIYPDETAVRKQVLWSSHLPGHEWQETIIINPPGTRPTDNIELKALTLANMAGATATYSWVPKPPKVLDEPSDPNIQLVNLKAKWKPFQVVSPDHSRITPYSSREKTFSVFPWWNHWPVAQIPSSGRSAVAPDRASHSSLSHIHWTAFAKHGDTETKILMDGLTTKSAADLVPLARSWISPPGPKVKGTDYQNDGYDPTQRAYVLTSEVQGKPARLDLTLAASRNSPVYDPAIVIHNWGESRAHVAIDGRAVSEGKVLRVGHVQNLNGTDLVIWLQKESVTPMEISVQPGS